MVLKEHELVKYMKHAAFSGILSQLGNANCQSSSTDSSITQCSVPKNLMMRKEPDVDSLTANQKTRRTRIRANITKICFFWLIAVFVTCV